MSTNWYENFFHGIALDFWRAAVTDELTLAEADFIQKHLQVSAPARLLDVPCGGGRLALELASRGFNLTGVDIASEFIAEAKAKSADRALNIDWRHGDMRDLPWESQFHGAFCFGNSFGYLDDDGNADCLKAIARTLKPGARFVLNTGATAESILPNFQPRRWFEIGGITLLIDSRYDHEQGRMFTEYTFIREGQVEKRPSSQRIYSYNEITRLLAAAGFETTGAYSSTHKDPFGLGSQQLFLLGRKPETNSGT